MSQWRKRQNPCQNQRKSLNLNHFNRLWIDHECQCQRLKYDKIWCFNLNSPSRGKGPNQDSDQSSAFLPMFLFKSLTVSNRFLKFNSVRLWKVCWTHLYMDCWIKWQTNFLLLALLCSFIQRLGKNIFTFLFLKQFFQHKSIDYIFNDPESSVLQKNNFVCSEIHNYIAGM